MPQACTEHHEPETGADRNTGRMAPIPENRKLPKREADLFKSILVRASSQAHAPFAADEAVVFSVNYGRADLVCSKASNSVIPSNKLTLTFQVMEDLNPVKRVSAFTKVFVRSRWYLLPNLWTYLRFNVLKHCA